MIRLAVGIYFRFMTSLRDAEEMLVERGIDVTCKTVRCWANRFGPAIAANTRKRCGATDRVWHLDDPWELNDLAAAQPERVQAMKERVDAFDASLPEPLWPIHSTREIMINGRKTEFVY